MTKFRLGIIIATLAVVGVATFLVIHQQSELREENLSLRQRIEQLAPLQAEEQASFQPACSGQQRSKAFKRPT